MKFKQILKAVLYLIFDFFRSVLWFVRQILTENFHNYLIKEERRKALAIFGNGPSLTNFINSKEVDEISNDYDSVLVNHAAISSFYDIIRPKYYIFADPDFWSNRKSAVKKREETFTAILTKTKWSMVLYVPYPALKLYPFKERFIENVFISIIPYHVGIWNGFNKWEFWIYRKGLAMPRVQNVVIGAIFNGINMGYKKIDLYGVEHSWTELIRVNEKNQVCTRDVHFYNKDEAPLEPWFQLDDKPFKMHEILRALAYMFESYHKLEEYAQSEGVKIINHTKNSFIDAFERA